MGTTALASPRMPPVTWRWQLSEQGFACGASSRSPAMAMARLWRLLPLPTRLGPSQTPLPVCGRPAWTYQVLSGGSTPTAVLTTAGLVTEIRPGIYVFGDAQQLELGTCSIDQIALTAAATVVSRAPGHVVIDAGNKVLGADRPAWTTGYGRLADHPNAQRERIVRAPRDGHVALDVSAPRARHSLAGSAQSRLFCGEPGGRARCRGWRHGGRPLAGRGPRSQQLSRVTTSNL